MKVLIVDDEEEICKWLQRELRKEGYEVDYTTSPVGVLEKLKEAKEKGKAYELLLLDLRMPQMNGLELLKGIREARLGLDVVIITGYGDEDKAAEAIRLGAFDYLRKPISLGELRTAVFRVRQKRAEEEKKALKHRVLVVDDEPDLCERIKRELEKEGCYEVAVAYDGVEGLEYFKNNRVDVAIADIRMPRMDGLEMLDKCREITDDFVSIVITGYGDHETAIEALKLSAFDYLKKPISLDELITSVSKGIEVLELRRGLAARKRELEIESALKGEYAKKIEREKNFSANIIATVPDSLLVLDRDLRIKNANRSFYEKIQTEPEKVIGTRITDILGNDDGKKLSSELTKLFGTGDMLENFELHYQSEKLGERVFNIRARGMLSAEEEEEEEEELVVLEDITELKRAKEEIQRTSRLNQGIIDAAPVGIITYDSAGVISQINRRHLEIDRSTILDPQKFIGYNIFEHPTIAENKLLDPLRKVLDGESFDMEFDKFKTLTAEIAVRVKGVPLINGNSEVIGGLVMDEDITELKEAEEKLLHSERLAAIGKLSASVAHEIRNPLGVVNNAAYYLKMTLPEPDETTREYLDIINNEVKRAGDIISTLLELTRSRLADRQEVEVSSLIDKTLEKFDLAENIELKKDIPADIPPIFADPVQIEQVFYNLINNALQAMSMPESESRDKGGELGIKVKLRKKKGKEMVEVSFSDTGVGISRENMKNLFEPLFTTKARGIGLGLSICKNLVEANDGEIEVQSEVGKGTTVRVSLPGVEFFNTVKST
ncbi:MAG: response regulator [Halobacteriota archaeon]